ncbi:hypothetical protein D9757_006232 [Collybiopsis confluens]|uniref:HMG box domain-containing protein n=1 Tax=Collybiopsis confluens TaxID=2823264 RepID=A0A8H5HJZ4_9AGAR|nr:hypothetical protein D9757_006232 [Collybiopsis confluens]
MTSHPHYSSVDAPRVRGDDRNSQSPSEDASNDGDSNQTLTSQTLNADGTPKRPMNAFMIFARRRRPQVSAENQSMRTGEISKILSKEWNSMPASEKQFYLDRAKELKETFNSKYPDYVYRRRPNHSRKRRKSDSHSVEGSGNPDSIPDNGMPRPYDDSIHSRPSGMPSYGHSDPYGRDSRHPYANADRPNHHPHSISPPLNHNGPLPSPRLPGHSNTIPALHSYLSSQNIPSSAQPHHMYGSSSAHSNWDHPRLDTKMGNDGRLDSPHGRPPSNGSSSMWPPPERSSSRGYAGQSGSPTGSGPNSAAGGSESNFNFPTLNSPFFPSGGSSESTQLPPPGSLNTSNSRNGYDHRSYSPPPLGASFAQSASRHGLGGLGNDGMTRSLPPVQSIPGYSQSGLGNGGGGGPPADMWSNRG